MDDRSHQKTKTLYVIRHAKSSWDSIFTTDFDRQLNERGHDTAPKMARFMKDRGEVPDSIISSPAVRAWETAQYFAQEFNIPTADIKKDQHLYHGGIDQIFGALFFLDQDVECAAIFGHNPGIEFFAMEVGNIHEHVSTCSVVKVVFGCDNWHDISEAKVLKSEIWIPKVVLI